MKATREASAYEVAVRWMRLKAAMARANVFAVSKIGQKEHRRKQVPSTALTAIERFL
jgi:hypothetical protein